MSTFEKDNGLNLEATELRLGLPGRDGASPSPRGINKRALPVDTTTEATVSVDAEKKNAPPTKAQVVGWPPVRSYRKSCMEAAKKTSDGAFVKVCMDGAPYLRKMDLKLYKAYSELLKALEDMFSFKAGGYTDSRGYDGADFVPTYEDKDGDWMLLGDVPWEMFVSSCKRLRIMKGSEAQGLAL